MGIYPVVLSGGTGTRLWPLSRAASPKQLQPLYTQLTLLQDTIARLPAPMAAPIIVCNVDHRYIVAEQLRQIKVEPLATVLEPMGRNTAAAALLVAEYIVARDPDAILFILPSDHIVTDTAAFHAAARLAFEAAAKNYIVTFGIKPNSAHTGYGYIRQGMPIPGLAGVYGVERFVEKPDLITAQSYLQAQSYSWNSGMFAAKAQTLIAQADKIDPMLRPPIVIALRGAKIQGEFLAIDPDAFAGVKNISLDHAIMEHTDRAAVVPADIGWNDIGSWEALWEVGGRDKNGNVLRGNVLARDTHNSLIRSEHAVVAVTGVSDLVIVVTPDAVLVTTRQCSQDVKLLVEDLKKAGRSET